MSDDAGGLAGLAVKVLPMVSEHARAVLAVCFVLAIAAVAIGLGVEDSTVRGLGVGLSISFIFVGMCLLYLLARASIDVESGAAQEHRELAAKVNGRYWQLVRNDQYPGVGLIEVNLSPVSGRHELSGTKYSPAGKPSATWWQMTVAIQDARRYKIFYSWEGQRTGEKQVVSGVGTFRFDPLNRGGTGWYTSGSLDELKFDVSSSVILRRATQEELDVLHGADRAAAEALARDVYADMNNAFVA